MAAALAFLGLSAIANAVERTAVTQNVQLSHYQSHSLRKAASLGPEMYTVDLSRSDVDSMQRASFLARLKEVRANVISAAQGVEDDTAFIAESEVPLKSQVLNERRLATYFGEICIGGCEQKFKVLFDTGSCEFWVPGPQCKDHTDAARCNKHAAFNPSKSQTWKEFPDGQKLSIAYLSGKVEGPLGKDVISLGPLQVSDCPIGAADQIDVPLLDDVDWDGILGLAYPNPKLQRQGVDPIFDIIMKKHLLRQNIFSYYLGALSGAVTFGGIDTKYMLNGGGLSTFTYAKVTDRGYWSIEIQDIELQYGEASPVSTGSCKARPNGRCKAIVDTGTYLIYGPKVAVEGALGSIQVHSCEDLRRLPSVIFVLFAGDGQKPARLRLKPEDYTLEFHIPKDGRTDVDCNDPKEKDNCKADCVVGIGPDGQEQDWTLGQVFLRSFYSVFDRDNDRIGFARSNPHPSS